MEEKPIDPFLFIYKTIFLFNPTLRPDQVKPSEE